jgi:anti-sigma factor RsiW
MNCKAVQTRLSAYLDRELTGEELLQLRAHLATCSECKSEENELRMLKSMLGQLPAPQPTEDLADRLCLAVLKNAKRESQRWTWKRSFVTFASVAAASMAATFFFLSLKSEPIKPTVRQTPDMAYDVAQDQLYQAGGDPTLGAPVVPVSNYVSR